MKKSFLAGLAIAAALCMSALSASASTAGVLPVASAAAPAQPHAKAKDGVGFAVAPAAVVAADAYPMGGHAVRTTVIGGRSPNAAALTTVKTAGPHTAGERWRS